MKEETHKVKPMLDNSAHVHQAKFVACTSPQPRTAEGAGLRSNGHASVQVYLIGIQSFKRLHFPKYHLMIITRARPCLPPLSGIPHISMNMTTGRRRLVLSPTLHPNPSRNSILILILRRD
jgi:hypothetical protein